MNARIFFLTACALLFIGAGCGNTNSSISNGGSATTTEVKKKPMTVSDEEKAYDACVAAGYSIGVGEDAGGTSISYCVFDNATACPLLLYGVGTCSLKSGAVAYDDAAGLALQDVRSCDETSPSVCGINKKTYVNACVAELQGIHIAHEDDCTPEEIASLAPSLPPQIVSVSKKTSKSGGISGSSSGGSVSKDSSSEVEKNTNTTQPLPPSDQLPNTPGPQAEWLSMLIDVTTAEGVQTPRALIEYCAFGKNTVYYFEQGGSPLFSALYDKTGTVMCFPHNDVNKSCPTYFNKENRGGSCTQVWKDKR